MNKNAFMILKTIHFRLKHVHVFHLLLVKENAHYFLFCSFNFAGNSHREAIMAYKLQKHLLSFQINIFLRKTGF
jgi:hypothetical protein